MKVRHWTPAILSLILLASCSAFRPGESSSEAYKTVRQRTDLAMSPGLVDSATKTDQLVINDKTLLPIVRGAELSRDGNVYFARVGAAPEAVWTRLLEFLEQYQFDVISQDNLSGLIETDWRAARSVDNGLIDKTTSMVKGWFGRGEPELVEKFIFRLERSQTGSRLFASHRRALSRGGKLAAQPGEPQIEAAILNRFIVYLGFGDRNTLAKVTEQASSQSAGEVVPNGFRVNKPIPLAWPAVERAIQELSFVVIGQERDQGLLGIRAGRGVAGLSDTIVGGAGAAPDLILSFIPQGNQTAVMISRRDGEAMDASDVEPLSRAIVAQIR